MAQNEAPIVLLGVDLNDATGLPRRLVMLCAKKMISLDADQDGQFLIPGTWRNSLHLWDESPDLAHPYEVKDPRSGVIQSIAERLGNYQILTIKDLIPDAETESAVRAEATRLRECASTEDELQSLQQAIMDIPI